MQKYDEDLVENVWDTLNINTGATVVGMVCLTCYYNNKLEHAYRTKSIAKNRFKKIMDLSNDGIIIIKE